MEILTNLSKAVNIATGEIKFFSSEMKAVMWVTSEFRKDPSSNWRVRR